MSYGDVTDLLEDEANQQSERGVSMGWWLWWGGQRGNSGHTPVPGNSAACGGPVSNYLTVCLNGG